MGTLKKMAKATGSGVMQCLLRAEITGRVVDWLAYERWRQRRRAVERRLRAEGSYGDEVTFGPFKGMRYSPQWASNRFEKIIGAYEAELHDLIEEICRRPYTTIINVGCAEGYYAVGLARRLPGARVHAYDLKPEMLELCRQNARLNGVAERVVTGGCCDPAELRKFSDGGKALVLSDCEGYELALLDPGLAPMLRQADVLVELHDFKNRRISSTIRERFAATHRLRVIQNAGLRYSHYPVLRRLSFAEVYAMTGEEREEIMDWFFLEANQPGGEA